MSSDGAPQAHLLWTGGWDSTFRLLELLLVQRRPVKTYYVAGRRRSTSVELPTMQRIAAQIPRAVPAARDLLAPTRIIDIDEVNADEEISACVARLRARSYLGAQYDVLARFASQARPPGGLELTIHRGDRAALLLRPHVVQHHEHHEFVWRLKPQCLDADLLPFAAFSFPLMQRTKLQMQRIARRRGHAAIMEMTWFCHKPTPEGQPCGDCNPCRYTIEEGMGRRLPMRSRLRYHRRSLGRAIRPRLWAAAQRLGLAWPPPASATR